MKKLIISIAAITMLTGLTGCKSVNDNKGIAAAKTEKENVTKKQENEKVFPYIGMSRQDAINKSSIGLADKVENFTGGYSATWYYKDGTTLYFNDEKITKITISPKIGMNKDQVLTSSWGKPEDINKTTNAYGTNEQWIYGNNKYLYFENGILQTIQE